MISPTWWRTIDQHIPVLVDGLAMSAVASGGEGSTDAAFPVFGRQSRFRLQVNWLRRNGRWLPATGNVWVHVAGQPPFLRPGDQVTVCGNLARYRPPMNPAERDFRAFHQASGERVFLQAPVATCIHVVPKSRVGWQWWLPRLRCRWQAILKRELRPSEAELAGALLLGVRDGFRSELRDPFMRTGTVHLLAISGLHVGILAAPWLFAARARLVPFRLGLWSVVILMALYAALAEARAPVVRASVLVQLLCFSWMTRRRASLVNSLGCAALAVLLHNPADLFSPGTQLSFLAVAVLGRCSRVPGPRAPHDPLDRLIWRTRSWWSRTRDWSVHQLTRMLVASLSVWLVTAPLVVQSFHIISPIAVVLNLVLCPPLALGLQAGFGMLLLANVYPQGAQILGTVCQWSLQWIQMIARLADAGPASCFWLVGPGTAAVALSYVCVACGWMLARRPGVRAICYLLAGTCLLAGWSHQAWQRHRSNDRLRCTILSVGHGTCVVLQLPGGSVWLYDAGRRGSIRGGVDSVSRYLWSQAIGRIDAIVLSHPDLDHYSLVPGLIERFGAKRFLMADPLLRADHPGEVWLATQLRRSGIEPESIAMGQSWSFGGGCSITVLHPAATASFLNDNAHSVVLAVQYQGMSILLPGDLESDGMQSLLQSPPWGADVVMAPHHGSLHSDPGRFLRWCRPLCCIVSGGDAELTSSGVPEIYASGPATRVLHTAVEGAIEIDIDAEGLRIRPFRQRDSAKSDDDDAYFGWSAQPLRRTSPWMGFVGNCPTATCQRKPLRITLQNRRPEVFPGASPRTTLRRSEATFSGPPVAMRRAFLPLGHAASHRRLDFLEHVLMATSGRDKVPSTPLTVLGWWPATLCRISCRDGREPWTFIKSSRS